MSSNESGYGSVRSGEYRYGESEIPPETEDSRAEQLAEQRGPPETERPTDAESFGSGLKLAGAPSETDDEQVAWDLVINEEGSLATVSGMEMLGQDLSFGIARETEPINGTISDELLADLANKYKNIINRDPRIARLIEQPEVEQTGVDTVGAEVEVVAEDESYHDSIVIPIQPV